MKPRPVKKDFRHDNSAGGIERRAEYAQQALYSEALIVSADVGPLMAACALIGVARRIALESGIPKHAFEGLLIDTLQEVNRGQWK